MGDPRVDVLEAIEAIRRLKARYFRMLDTGDWDGLVRVFTDEVVVDIEGGLGPSSGPRTQLAVDFVDGVRRALTGAVTVHHGHMPEIDVHSAVSASGTWAMADEIWFPASSPVAHLRGAGHYHETYTRLDGGWRIASMKLTRLHVDIEKA